MAITHTWKPAEEIRQRMDPEYWITSDGTQALEAAGHCVRTIGELLAHAKQGDTPRAKLGEAYQDSGIVLIEAGSIAATGIDLSLVGYIGEKQHARLRRSQPR